jgi:pyridoxine 5-phosphate synthase
MNVRQLGVCLDAVAALRQARRAHLPDPVGAAAIAEAAGANSIIVHLREDRRFILDRDVRLLRQTVHTCLNLRMAATQELLKTAYDIKPDEVTLVADSADELGAQTAWTGLAGGLDINQHKDRVRKFVHALADADLAVQILLDPDLEQVRGAHRVEIGAVVLDTSKYALARGPAARAAERQRIEDAAHTAHKLGMQVAVAGGIDYQNIAGLCGIAEIEEVQVGHSIVAQSLLCGLERAVRDMKNLCVG